MAESVPSLKRLLDYKLLFDCLADEATGKISVPNLSIRWPRDSEAKGEFCLSGYVIINNNNNKRNNSNNNINNSNINNGNISSSSNTGNTLEICISKLFYEKQNI